MLVKNGSDKVLSPVARVPSFAREEVGEDFGPGTGVVVKGVVQEG